MPEIEVAAVIVSFRSAELTIEALRSIQAERASGTLRIRAIVIDNASGDLPAIARAVRENGWDSWVALIGAPRNGGFAYGNNLGIEYAYQTGTPAYVYLLNPDAQVRPGAIGTLVHFLTQKPDVGIAGSSFENLDGSDWPIAFRFPTLLSELIGGLQFGLVSRLLRPWVIARVMTKTSQPVDWICGASMMVRSEVFAAIGGLDENYFLYYEETDFCWRAHKAGFPTWYVPESRVMHIAGQSTGVNEPAAAPKRLPAYWFESRRRYFAMTHGTAHAMVIDVTALFANLLGGLKRSVLRRSRTATPYFIRDLLHHSVLWRRNRKFDSARCASVRVAVENRVLGSQRRIESATSS